jgi:hypothetical protein
MENKTLSESERALLLKLREAVNGEEEFDWLEAELARFPIREMEVSDGF